MPKEVRRRLGADIHHLHVLRVALPACAQHSGEREQDGDLLLPADLSWLVIGFIALFWLLSIVADFGGVILGTRWFGGSKWGMAGASDGAFGGLESGADGGCLFCRSSLRVRARQFLRRNAFVDVFRDHLRGLDADLVEQREATGARARQNEWNAHPALTCCDRRCDPLKDRRASFRR